MYDFIIQNNASKKITYYSGLENDSESYLYFRFSNFEFTQGEQDGEYSYFLVFNDRTDVEYDFSEVPLNSVVKTDDGNVLLRDLHPITGLMRIGQPEIKTTYKKNNEKTEYLYRK